MEPCTIPLTSTEAKRSAVQLVFGAPDGWLCKIVPPQRSLSQNALIHKWFGEIAAQTYDTAADVKLYCKGHFGVPILQAENPDFVAFYERVKQAVPDPQARLQALRYVSITSEMTTRQLKNFADAVFQHFTAQGIRLTVPEDRG